MKKALPFVRIRFAATLVALSAALAAVSGCGKPAMDCKTDEGRAAIVDAVDEALSRQDCNAAVAVIEPAYQNPDCASNEIRMARAGAHACVAGLSFFQLLSDLGTSSISGADLWKTLTALFPSNIGDPKVTAGQRAQDALFAMLKPGVVVNPTASIFPSSANPGSLRAMDRYDEANIYSVLVSMSLVGALQNRYGAPDGNHKKTQALGRIAGNPDGWMRANFVDPEACTYASAILNLFDGLAASGSTISGSLGSDLTALVATFQSGLDAACEAGCNGSIAQTGCSLPAGSCSPCPIQLHHYASCHAVLNEREACAAAGIAYFINTSPVGWQGPL